jgi:hypothetical protein
MAPSPAVIVGPVCLCRARAGCAPDLPLAAGLSLGWMLLYVSMLSRELHLTPALRASGCMMPVPLSARSLQSIACAVAVFGSPALCLTGRLYNGIERAAKDGPSVTMATFRDYCT